MSPTLCLTATLPLVPTLAAAPPPEVPGGPDVRITEIMYNPASHERGGATEWVEIANLGTRVATLDGWYLDDEDRGHWGAFSCTLEPGAVVVLVNQRTVTREVFVDAWFDDDDPPATVLPVRWQSLANTPGPDNERLQLLDSRGRVRDEVDLHAGPGWPVPPEGASLTLVRRPDSSRDGTAWQPARPGIDHARAVTPGGPFNGPDIGSPGRLPDSLRPSSEPPAPDHAPRVDPRSGDRRLDFIHQSRSPRIEEAHP